MWVVELIFNNLVHSNFKKAGLVLALKVLLRNFREWIGISKVAALFRRATDKEDSKRLIVPVTSWKSTARGKTMKAYAQN